MNISFAKLGVEECETCDEYKIHKEGIMQKEGHTNTNVDRNKRKKDAVTDTMDYLK